MNKYTFTHNGFTFERISKEKARSGHPGNRDRIRLHVFTVNPAQPRPASQPAGVIS